MSADEHLHFVRSTLYRLPSLLLTLPLLRRSSPHHYSPLPESLLFPLPLLSSPLFHSPYSSSLVFTLSLPLTLLPSPASKAAFPPPIPALTPPPPAPSRPLPCLIYVRAKASASACYTSRAVLSLTCICRSLYLHIQPALLSRVIRAYPRVPLVWARWRC